MNEQEATAVLDRPRLKKLVIHRYRHVKPGTTLVFDDTWNVIVGKNGTGKTTLLKLIEKLMQPRMVSKHRDPLHAELEFEVAGGVLTTSVEWDLAPKYGLQLLGRFQSESRDVRWFTNSRGTLEFQGADMPELSGQFYMPPLFILQLVGAFKSVMGPTRFDESLGCFDRATQWQLLRDKSGDAVLALHEDSFLPTFAAARFRDPALDVHAPMSWDSESDSLLRSFERLASVGRPSCTVRLHRVDVEDDATVSIHGPPSFTFTRESGSSFGHNDLSFGQKRLLAFLYYLEMNAPILLVDELSNGFHRSWIEYAVEQMQTRQNFAATQNPLLLDRIPFHSPEELQRSLIFCREEDGKFVWENAKADDMQEVYAAYDVGLEKVSDLLWRKGMW